MVSKNSTNTKNRKTNENILKLRELADKLCSDEFNDSIEVNYKSIIGEVKKMVETEYDKIIGYTNKEDKLKGYDKLCFKLKIILNKIKLT